MSNGIHGFCSAVAQHQNLGDAVLRRTMLGWFREVHKVHLLGRGMPSDYLEFVTDTSSKIVIHNSRLRWGILLLWHTIRGDASLAYSPGPQLLFDNLKSLTREWATMGLTLALRLRGCAVIRLGRSLEGTGPLMAKSLKAHARLMALSSVRDSRTLAWRDQTSPDVAVLWGDRAPDFAGGYLGVAVRFDRGHDVASLIEICKELSSKFDLKPIILTQVSFDEEIGQSLAAGLGCAHVRVGYDQADIADYRKSLRNCRVLLSDRLHTLIFGLSHGALPLVLDGPNNPKCTSALAQIGIPEGQLAWSPSSIVSMDNLAVVNEDRLKKARARARDLEDRARKILNHN